MNSGINFTPTLIVSNVHFYNTVGRNKGGPIGQEQLESSLFSNSSRM